MMNIRNRTNGKVNWYRLNRSLHRDIGYLCIGLTLVFAISGIAVNHIRDWNPNYQIIKKIQVQPDLIKLEKEADIINVMLAQFNIDQTIKAKYWVNDNEFKIFLKNGSNLNANLINGEIQFEHISERLVLRRLNSLHLNEVKSAWIVFSDAYAILLIFLAISALFMVKGKHSPWGRKGVLVLIGFAIPLIFILLV